MLGQIIAVISMNLRSIPQRLWMSLATMISVAVVVAVLLAFLAMGNGFKETMQGTGSDNVAVLIRAGSQAELNSVVMGDQVKLISTSEAIVNDAQGPILSAELYLVVDGMKRSSQTKANIPLRGIQVRGLELRENVRITQGRMFETGKNEIVVGEAILREFEDFEVGKEVKLGQTIWTVVGTFSANGSVFESELWADALNIQNQFNRGSTYQIVRAKIKTPGDVTDLKASLADDKRLNLDIQTEKAFYAEQSGGVSDLIFYLGWPLAIAMALGALAGALNTMYNSVAQRAGEIATLRAIGFPGLPVFMGTMIESLMLSAVGGIAGSLIAFLFFDGMSASTMGSSFTQIVFEFDISLAVFQDGILLALIIGAIGGFFPAIRAARMSLLKAFSAAT